MLLLDMTKGPMTTMTAIIETPDIGEQFQEVRLLASLIFPFDPVPASRPRVTKRTTYYGKTYKAWKQQAERWLSPGTLHLDIARSLWVEIEVIVRKPETTRLAYPKGDIDNYTKGPLDVITKVGGYWQDDRQVVGLISSKRFADKDEHPKTEVHIYACA